MKKCPYCKTLMNDDVNSCPNCLKNVPLDNKMPDIVSSKNKSSFYMMFIGLIVSIGSLAAAFSQKANKLNYQSQFESYKKTYNEETVGDYKNHLQDLMEKAYSSQKSCEFREYAFYVFCVLGIILIILGIIFFIKNRRKK